MNSIKQIITIILICSLVILGSLSLFNYLENTENKKNIELKKTIISERIARTTYRQAILKCRKLKGTEDIGTAILILEKCIEELKTNE